MFVRAEVPAVSTCPTLVCVTGSPALEQIDCSPRLGVIHSLMSKPSITSSTSAVKKLDRMGPRTGPCVIPRITAIRVAYNPQTTTPQAQSSNQIFSNRISQTITS